MVIFIVCFFFFYSQVITDKFDDFKGEMEGKVKGLAQAMKYSYDRRCEEDVAQCKIKSYNEC